jgi:mxaA protein
MNLIAASRRRAAEAARVVTLVSTLVAAGAALGAQASVLDAVTSEPRAFGYQVGDTVRRRVIVQVPEGLVLDETSLPRPGARGRALELRALRRVVLPGSGMRREELTLDYQVFLAPPAVRTLEMPPFTLRYEGTPRAQDLRVDAWPVTVAPLVPVDVSPRNGLGELQPDTPPPLIDTDPARTRLGVYAVVLAALLAYLAVAYLGLPWRGARRPFGLAWKRLRHLQGVLPAPAWHEACRQLHAALNQSAGEVLFERGVEAFTRRRPAFAPLHADIVQFLHLSHRAFFAGEAQAPGDAAWLLAFCRRCRDAERGT